MENTDSGLWFRYLQFLNQQDAGIAAELFTEDAYFDDMAARSLGGTMRRCLGRAEIQSFFSKLFSNHQVTASGIVRFGSRQFYNICLDGTLLLRCVGRIDTRGGKISQLEIELRL